MQDLEFRIVEGLGGTFGVLGVEKCIVKPLPLKF